MKSVFVFFVLILSFTLCLFSQSNEGQITGNFQIDMQSYKEDSTIGAPKVREYVLMNAYSNIIYTKGGFTAGIRYEAYLNSLQGFDPANNGQGLPYRFASYTTDELEITAGSFYEQFGSGIILRAYEEKALGIDNAIDGFRVRAKPYSGVYITGIYGKQRLFFDKGPGIVRGTDGEFNINEIFSCFEESKTRLSFGGSFVSKYQIAQHPLYKLPENVGAWASRLNFQRGGFILTSEYANKINDPSAENNYIYKTGQGLVINTTYSTKGLGLMFATKWIDNMGFRSDRNAAETNLMINYLPVINKQFTYALANMYPYATQPNGEFGVQGEIMYRIKKETLLGGKYGTNINLGFSRVNAIDRIAINDTISISQSGTLGYTSDLFNVGDELYYQEFTVEINKRLYQSLLSTFVYQNIIYNYDVLRVPGYEMVYANTAIADITYRINKKNSIRFQQEYLFTKQDMGNWLMFLAEYSTSSKWFITFWNQYNVGNDKYNSTHYPTGSITFVNKGTRLQLGYGRQRQGVICIGGVCKNVPASNGLIFSLTSTF